MSTQDSNQSPPQFGTAEYSGQSADTCMTCESPIVGPYYRVSGAMTCASCAAKATADLPKDSASAFTRALMFGLGGALLGLILYSAVGIITGLVIGYVSLAVGWIVGKAMMMGSGGIGGRRYQIVALVLTYAAVSLSAIPMAIAQFVREGDPRTAQEAAAAQSAAPDSKPSDAANSAAAPSGSSTPTQPQEPEPGLASVLLTLAFIGLASPFLALESPMHGLIGLVILAVGLQIAWSITAGQKVEVLGPYNSGS